jgi:hypothetical protein
VYVSADCDGAFLRDCEQACDATQLSDVPLAGRSTRPAGLRGPVAQSVSMGSIRAMGQRPVVAYLLAQPLHVALGQLLAAHEALDPAVQGGDGRGLRRGSRRQLHGLGHLDVLHVGIHGWGGSGWWWGRLLMESSRGVLALKLGE